jgi:transcriptional regulator with XRE-family HTH domain
MEIGKLIRDRRVKLNVALDILATKLQVTTEYLMKIEDGKIDPTFGTVSRILSVLNTDIESLIGVKEVEKIVEVEKEIVVEKEVPVKKKVVVEVEKVAYVDEKRVIRNLLREFEKSIKSTNSLIEDNPNENTSLTLENMNLYVSNLTNNMYFKGYREGLIQSKGLTQKIAKDLRNTKKKPDEEIIHEIKDKINGFESILSEIEDDNQMSLPYIYGLGHIAAYKNCVDIIKGEEK